MPRAVELPEGLATTAFVQLARQCWGPCLRLISLATIVLSPHSRIMSLWNMGTRVLSR
jgi:hypothetical protein